jgi:hypothetical protein
MEEYKDIDYLKLDNKVHTGKKIKIWTTKRSLKRIHKKESTDQDICILEGIFKSCESYKYDHNPIVYIKDGTIDKKIHLYLDKIIKCQICM